MASTILYKFRSGTNFESLPLPGTSARLFDIKRAIVRAKKLDRSATGSGLEFDFSIQNATTNEVYEDESMVLPRGTRIIVRRVAAEKNQGLLSRIARAEVSGGVPPPMMGAGGGAGGAAQNGFYTIRSRDRDGEDEFLDEEPPQQAVPSVSMVDESKELEALKAVTDQASMYGSGMPRNSNSQMNKVWSAGGGGSGGGAGGGIAGSGPPRGGAPHFSKPPQRSRPNADPELREQELRQQPQTKKRATGIPRTFLSLNAPSNAAAPGAEGDLQNENTGENAADGGGLASQLQPNTIGFEALVNRAGGQSIGASGKRRDLDYALKLTATSIPEHLLCGICNSVVKNAMLIPWDTEGRPCCESCIRDSLTQNGFKCPLTGTEGVSPDDLFANVGLRKAADLFVQGVMAKMDQIEKQIEAEEAEEEKNLERAGKNNDVYEGEGGDRGILVTRSMSKQNGKKRQEDDLFGEEDEFGGDVFDVCGDDDEAEEAVENVAESSNDKTLVSHASKPVGIDIDSSSAIDNNNKSEPKDHTVSGTQDQNGTSSNVENNTESKGAPNEMINNISANSNEPLPRSQTTDPATAQQAISNGEQGANKKSTPVENAASSSSSRPSHYRREVPKRRGPPAGYVLGPAGGGMAASSSPAAKGPMAAHAMGSFVPGSFPPPPPPPPPVGGRGANVMGAPSHMGRGNNGGGRFPQNQYGPRDPFHGGRGGRNMMPPDQQQQQYPDQRQQQQHYGGYGDSGRGRQHSHQGRGGRFNRRQEQQDQHWGENRKRPRDAMDGNPMQEATQQGWGGSGPQYAGGRNHFDGRGGGFNGGGRGRAGGFRGRGGGRGYGRGGRF